MSGSVGSSLIPCFLLQLLFIPGVFSAIFTLTNNCDYTVWPGLLSGAGTPPLSPTGFSLTKDESRQIPVPKSWSGRLWGRTLCRQDAAGSKFSCATGDCGTGKVECSGTGPTPPATLAEFTLNGDGGMDFFDVSLVDGFNLPVSVAPQAGGSGRRGAAAGNCTAAECVADINGACPAELRVADGRAAAAAAVACRSACDAFGGDEYCCRGAYGGPGTCKPTSYSRFFKRSCPRAYSYAYDDGSSTFTCGAAQGYVITFCPSIPSKKSSSDGGEKAEPAMVFVAGPYQDFSTAASLRRPSIIISVTAGAALVSLWHVNGRYN